MLGWLIRLRRQTALKVFLERLEYEGFTVGRPHSNSETRTVRFQGKLIGHVDNTVCFIYASEDRNEPDVKRVIDIAQRLRMKAKLAVSISDGGKRQEAEVPAG
ncbi:MAG: hypothetical protein Q7K38_00250 [Candidatus Wildermuthbacteria bacterium]|nr:hypothetical protein [Candidatus Wildermuthbacteria bacterium]